MTDPGEPTYIYKLVPSSSPVPPFDELPERLPVSDIDKSSGFIHLSTARQVPGTLRFFFTDDPKVYVLRLRYDDVKGQIRWEDPRAEVCGPRGGEGMFPVYARFFSVDVGEADRDRYGQHLYNGSKLGKDEIESVYALEKTSDADGTGDWDKVLRQAHSWLV